VGIDNFFAPQPFGYVMTGKEIFNGNSMGTDKLVFNEKSSRLSLLLSPALAAPKPIPVKVSSSLLITVPINKLSSY